MDDDRGKKHGQRGKSKDGRTNMEDEKGALGRLQVTQFFAKLLPALSTLPSPFSTPTISQMQYPWWGVYPYLAP